MLINSQHKVYFSIQTKLTIKSTYSEDMQFINITFSLTNTMKNIYLFNSKADLFLKNTRLLLSAEERIQRQLDFGFLLFITGSL
jgi:hypothetical protein